MWSPMAGRGSPWGWWGLNCSLPGFLFASLDPTWSAGHSSSVFLGNRGCSATSLGCFPVLPLSPQSNAALSKLPSKLYVNAVCGGGKETCCHDCGSGQLRLVEELLWLVTFCRELGGLRCCKHGPR